MADLCKTPQKGLHRPSRSRRQAITQEEIEVLKQTVAVTTKANRPFVYNQTTAPGEETQRKIVLASITVFGRIECMTRLTLKEY